MAWPWHSRVVSGSALHVSAAAPRQWSSKNLPETGVAIAHAQSVPPDRWLGQEFPDFALDENPPGHLQILMLF